MTPTPLNYRESRKTSLPLPPRAKVVSKVESLGLKSHVIVGSERTVVAAIGEKRNGEQEALSSMGAPWKLTEYDVGLMSMSGVKCVSRPETQTHQQT